jgi:hypothetical protein
MTRALLVAAVLSLLAAAGGQAAVTTNTQIPSEFTFFNACTQELVAVSGQVHVLSTSTASGATLSGTFHSDFHATGVGQSSGLPYQEEVVANSSFQTSLLNGEATQTFVGRITIAAPGRQDNQTSPISMHATMNANGEITSLTVEPPTVVCQ